MGYMDNDGWTKRETHEFLELFKEFVRLVKKFVIHQPTTLTINLPKEESMAAPMTYPVGAHIKSLPATEFDTNVNPPAVFIYANGSVVYTQSGGAGAFTDNGDGTFDYQNTLAEVVTVTASDSVSNPNLSLEDSVVITFAAAAELPNQLNINLPAAPTQPAVKK